MTGSCCLFAEGSEGNNVELSFGGGGAAGGFDFGGADCCWGRKEDEDEAVVVALVANDDDEGAVAGGAVGAVHGVLLCPIRGLDDKDDGPPNGGNAPLVAPLETTRSTLSQILPLPPPRVGFLLLLAEVRIPRPEAIAAYPVPRWIGTRSELFWV